MCVEVWIMYVVEMSRMLLMGVESDIFGFRGFVN